MVKIGVENFSEDALKKLYCDLDIVVMKHVPKCQNGKDLKDLKDGDYLEAK